MDKSSIDSPVDKTITDFDTEELALLLGYQEGGENGDSDNEDEDQSDNDNVNGEEEEQVDEEGILQSEIEVPITLVDEREQAEALQAAQLEKAGIVQEAVRVDTEEPYIEPAMDAALSRMEGEDTIPTPDLGVPDEAETPAPLAQETGQGIGAATNPFLAMEDINDEGEVQTASLGYPQEDEDRIEADVATREGEDFEDTLIETEWGDFVSPFTIALTAEQEGQIDVFRVEVRKQVAASIEGTKMNLDALANTLGQLIDEQYPKMKREDRSDLLEIYLKLFKEAIDDQNRPVFLQRMAVPPLVTLYHDGRFVQPWLKPIMGDLKKVFSENRLLFGERVFTDIPTGPEAVLQTMEVLTSIVTDKNIDRVRAAGQAIADELRSYFIDTKNPALNKKVDPESFLSDDQEGVHTNEEGWPLPVLAIIPIGKEGEYTIDIYRFDNKMTDSEKVVNLSRPLTFEREDELEAAGEGIQNIDFEVADNRDLCFKRAHELEIPRYVNKFISGLFEVKDRSEDPLAKRKGRGRKREYSEKTPLAERIIKRVEKMEENPTLRGQIANIRGFLREPLITTPSAFQIWYMKITQDERKKINNPQQVWLNLTNAEAAPYFQEFYALREEHLRKSKLFIVPYEELIKNPEEFRISKTWRDTYVIFLLPNRTIYTYDQALDRLNTKYFPNIKRIVNKFHINLADEMQTKERFMTFVNRYKETPQTKGNENVLSPLTSEQTEEFDKDWINLRSFIEYIEFLKMIIGNEEDIVRIHRSMKLPTIVGDARPEKDNETIKRTSVFSLDNLLNQFSMSLAEIDPKFLQYIQKPSRKKIGIERKAILRTIRDIVYLLLKPSKIKDLRALNRGPSGIVSQPGSGLNSASFLADNKLFTNDFLTKVYGNYPYFGTFKDSLDARIYWIMHTPDQGNLFFQINYYNYLILLLANLDPRLVPNQWDESQAINYRELLIHIETAGPDLWPLSDRIGMENWTNLRPIREQIDDMYAISQHRERIAEIDRLLEMSLQDPVNKSLALLKYQGLYYLPAPTQILEGEGEGEEEGKEEGKEEGEQEISLADIGIWYPDDNRYYDRNAYLLKSEHHRLEEAIKDYNDLRSIYLSFPILIKSAYESILLAQNKCLNLANRARRLGLFQTLEVSVQDHELQPEDLSSFQIKKQQLELIRDPVTRNELLLDLFDKETVTDGKNIFTRNGEIIGCIHELDELRLSRTEFLERYDNGHGLCRICEQQIDELYDPHMWGQMGEGTIMVNPNDADDNRVTGACLRYFYGDRPGTSENRINLEHVDTDDPYNVALLNQLSVDVDIRNRPLNELDHWICQMIQNISQFLISQRQANKSQGALLTILEDYTLLTKIIDNFQTFIEYSVDDLSTLVEVTEEEIARHYPDLVAEKNDKIATATRAQAEILAAVQRDLDRLDPRSIEAKRKKEVIKRIKREDPVAMIEARHKENMDNIRRIIRLDKFVNRYILLLESIVKTLMSEVADPQFIASILNDITLLLVDNLLARFAIAYQYENQSVFPNITDSVALARSDLLVSENGKTIKERFDKFLKISGQEYSQHEEAWNKSIRLYEEMGRLDQTDDNFYYNIGTFEKLLPSNVFLAITSTTVPGRSDLSGLDLSFITSRDIIDEIQKFLGQQLYQYSRELFRLFDQRLVRDAPFLNEGNLNKGNTQCFIDMRQFYFGAILEFLRNNQEIELITKSEIIRDKLARVLTPEFITEIQDVYDRIRLIRIYIRLLRYRYSELIVHNQSITPNDEPYLRSSKTTYVDMSTGSNHSQDFSFPVRRPILPEPVLEIIRDPLKLPDRLNLRALGEYISKRIARDLARDPGRDLAQRQDPSGSKRRKETRITEESVLNLLGNIGKMPDKRREELMTNKNPFFEGSEEVLIQIYLNTIQLLKSLNINYSRFYHSLLSNFDFEQLQETYPDIASDLNFSSEAYARLKLILNLFEPEIPNRIIDRTYVYQAERYGNRALLATHGDIYKPDPIIVATSPEEQSDEWIPEQPSTDKEVISRKLRNFLLENINDTQKCYQSMKPEEAIDAETLRRFLLQNLLQDIYGVYKRLEEENRQNDIRIYSLFVYRLVLIMVRASETYFQPEDLSERLRNLWQQKMRDAHKFEKDKDSFSSELIKLGRIASLADPEGDMKIRTEAAGESEVGLVGTGADVNRGVYDQDVDFYNANPDNEFGAFIDIDQFRDENDEQDPTAGDLQEDIGFVENIDD